MARARHVRRHGHARRGGVEIRACGDPRAARPASRRDHPDPSRIRAVRPTDTRRGDGRGRRRVRRVQRAWRQRDGNEDARRDHGRAQRPEKGEAMTLVHFHLTDAEGSGLSGSVSLVPTRRVTVRDAIRLPVAQTVRLDNGEAAAEVMPSTTQWVWRVSELVAGGGVRYVEVPDSSQTVEYSGLVDVDPATLDPSATTVAAWETVTRAAQSALDQIDTIDDKVARAESSAQAAKASEGVAGQEAGKATDAAAKALASQQAATASANLAHESETTAQGLIGEARSIAQQINDSAAQVRQDAATADTAAKTAGGKADAAIDAQARAEAARQAAEAASQTATDKAVAAGESAATAQASESASAKSAESASRSQSAAAASESNAARSAQAAADSADKAAASESTAAASAASAKQNAQSASGSAREASGKAAEAAASAANAKASESAAQTSQTAAAKSAAQSASSAAAIPKWIQCTDAADAAAKSAADPSGFYWWPREAA
uniref:Uncharacterized protein n=1 Tax=Siphoviridae sp. ctB9E3 TaxID=2826187 RepID=A0A8S5QPS2_9CAUD|nr:MAG TPA: hypothetical protein [Siphoviridae sp. ctB9E3]